MRDDIAEKIAHLSSFKADIQAHFDGNSDGVLRTRISRRMPRARELVREAGVMKTVTLSPPPAVGGLMVRNADPFEFILRDYYGMSLIPAVSDMIEEAIGVLEDPDYERRKLAVALSAESDMSASTATQPPELPLPDKVTLSWLVRHVPVSFWLWLLALLTTAFAVGVKLAPLLAP